ncbi:MAG: family 78 glycoside hydrolase catalytic domain [Acidimicrobiia bacterium]
MLEPHPPPFATRWRARWIWDHQPAIVPASATRPVLADPTDHVALLRRGLELSEVPESAPCRIWADGRYLLRVNGVELARGPVRSNPRSARYDVVDLAPALVRGTNVIAIVARHYGRATSWWIPTPPTYSLGGGGIVFECLVGENWLVSDGEWRAIHGNAWTPVEVPGDVACLPMESFDARDHPHGWDEPGFDASRWPGAVEITPFHTGADGDPHPPSDPFGVIGPPVRKGFPDGATHRGNPVSSRTVTGVSMGSDPVRQVAADEASGSGLPDPSGTEPAPRIPDAGDGSASLQCFDLGRVAAGTMELEVSGATPGTTIDVAAAEHVDEEGRLVFLGQHAGARYICAGRDEERFESFDPVGARHLHVSVRGKVKNLSVAVRDRHRPRPAGASFSCSDPLLEQIHQIGLRTVDLSAPDAYIDCPTREQRAWTGDSVVHQMVDLVSNPDWSMPRWHPRLAAAPRADRMLPMAAASDFAQEDRMFVPDWSLHWVRSVHNLYRYTGDRELVAELLPVAAGTLRWFERYLEQDGLLHDVTGWVLLDWASVYSGGCSSTLNALWARALEDLADMARWLGDVGTAQWAMNRRGAVYDAFEAFWDESRSVYVDHTTDGRQQRAAAQHGGAAALAAGLVPPERIDAVVGRLTDPQGLLRHSWVMDTVTREGDSSGFVHLMTGYPEPEWDVESEMVECEPFFRYVLHDGLARAGRADLIAGLCRDWKVFLDAGETTWPECWVGGTRCHGWSSTPTRDLVVHTLGIQPAEPGYASVRVAPALGELEWARATVPSPHGPISVEAHADGRVEVDSPVPFIRD